MIRLRAVSRRALLGQIGQVPIRLGGAVAQIRAARRRHTAVSLLVVARFTTPRGVRSKPFSISIARLR